MGTFNVILKQKKLIDVFKPSVAREEFYSKNSR